jgi:hypothetical protein
MFSFSFIQKSNLFPIHMGHKDVNTSC